MDVTALQRHTGKCGMSVKTGMSASHSNSGSTEVDDHSNIAPSMHLDFDPEAMENNNNFLDMEVNDDDDDDDDDSMDSMPALSQRVDLGEIEEEEDDLCQGDLIVNVNFHEERERLIPSETNIDPPAEVSEATPFDFQHFLASSPRMTKQDLSMMKILKECDDASTPKGFFDKIMALLKKETFKNGFDIAKAQTRGTFMSNLHSKFPSPKPRVVQVPLRDKKTGQPTNHCVGVMVFPFLDQLTDLLQDHDIFSDPANLCLNIQEADFYAQFNPQEQDRFNESMGADWYRRTYQQFITDPNSEVLIPIILYADCTGTDAYQRYSLEPWMFTLALFRRHVRERSSSWKHLGFQPSPDTKAFGTKFDAESLVQLYHDCLKVMLADLIHCQKNPPVRPVRFGGVTKNVTLRIVVAYIMGDQKSQDVVVGRKPVTKTAGRIHRSCMTSHPDASNCDRVCQWVNRTTILKLTSIAMTTKDATFMSSFDAQYPSVRGGLGRRHRAMLYVKRRSALAKNILAKVYSSYTIDNAFTPVCFGANANGVNRATLDDPMHVGESGCFEYIIKSIYDPMTEAESTKIDFMVEEMLGKSNLRSSVRDMYPRINFTRGFSRLTLLTCGE